MVVKNVCRRSTPGWPRGVSGGYQRCDGEAGDGLGWRTTKGLDAEFVAFVHRRGPHHLRIAVLLTGDWHTAEDLTQTCLVKLYQV
jgi:hypothetical protein